MVDFESDLVSCLDVLHKGGLILYPTDTVWGIGCDASNTEAVNKIFLLKKRKETKGLIVLVADERDVLKYVSQPDLRVFEYLKSISKPTTVIYEGAIGLAENLVGEDGSVAIRMVRETFCRHLVKRFRKPLVSTSANISGQPAPHFFHDIPDDVKTGVDYTVQYRRDDVKIAAPSSIIRWNKDATITTLRP